MLITLPLNGKVIYMIKFDLLETQESLTKRVYWYCGYNLKFCVLHFSSKTYLILRILICSLENKAKILIKKIIFFIQSFGAIFTSHDVISVSSYTAPLTYWNVTLILAICCEGQFPYTVQEMGGFIHHLSWQPMLCPKSTPTFLLSFCTSRFVPLRAIFLDTHHLSYVHSVSTFRLPFKAKPVPLLSMCSDCYILMYKDT